MKTQSFDELVKNTVIKILNEQAPPPPPGAPTGAPPADASKISPDDKEQLDPNEFVAARIKALIELGPEDLFDSIRKMNIEAKKPLQIKSIPIDQSKNVEDFIKSFKKNYTSDYLTLKRFIDVTNEGSQKFELLKKDIKNLIKLSKDFINTDQETVTPSNMQAAPM